MSEVLLSIDSVQQMIKDRKRLKTSASPDLDAEIKSKLNEIQLKLKELEKKQNDMENDPQIPEFQLKQKEQQLVRYQQRFSRVEEMYREIIQRKNIDIIAGGSNVQSISSQDEDRSMNQSGNTSAVTSISNTYGATMPDNDSAIELGTFTPNHAGTADSNAAQDIDVEALHNIHTQMLLEQEESLVGLEQSVQNQRTLGLQMNSELDEHNTLLNSLSGSVDDTGNRLRRARGRLQRVTKKAEQYPHCFIIFLLLLVLFLVISV
ncbi:SNARE Fsv1 [Schizosaccharomyces japonicus yFS275]|uniref:SNARE Fsv1 n=1 Tax=Schizosaccharomyces japonicus (strain yFS275 / FY16936) TaxID=402676 RepID=B6K3Z9_SCHJY|nr:SNARE Fsv1 [Schizosaccharomyces japonicus yFS275]EEB08206.2 SNARE Fsv1 [Schizosaccharomyces japonicus yFS275]